MDSGVVNRAIRNLVRPILKAHGFAAFTPRSAWRFHDRVIDVVNFQSFNRYNADVLGCTTFSFAVNLGVYLTDVPSDVPIRVRQGRLIPEEHYCHIRRRLEPTVARLPNARDIWVIDETGHNVDEAVQDSAVALVDIAMSWFERFKDISEVLAILREEIPPPDIHTWLPGRLDSPARNIATGYVARSVGHAEIGAEYLRAALSQLQATNAAFKEAGIAMNMTVPKHLVEAVAALHNSSD